VIGIFMSQLMAGQPMTIFGDGHQTRAFSHIDDVAPAISRCVELSQTANQTYNIGADEPHSVLALAHAVASAFGSDARIEHLAPRKEVMHAYANHDKLVEHFGASHHVPLATGLAKMATWAKQVGNKKATPSSSTPARSAPARSAPVLEVRRPPLKEDP
jgi:UDP-glucose 4-epimerase